MKETKLDKAVDKLFRFVERFSNKIIGLGSGLNPYFGLVLCFIYIPYIIFFLIDIYFNGWKFLNLSDGKINISFIYLF